MSNFVKTTKDIKNKNGKIIEKVLNGIIAAVPGIYN